MLRRLSLAVGQEAAKAYLINITTAKSLKFEPGAELSDDL